MHVEYLKDKQGLRVNWAAMDRDTLFVHGVLEMEHNFMPGREQLQYETTVYTPGKELNLRFQCSAVTTELELNWQALTMQFIF